MLQSLTPNSPTDVCICQITFLLLFRCVISLGDLQSEEERDIIIPINLEALEAECVGQPLIKVTLSYFNVITTLMQTTTVDLAVDRKSAGTYF